MKTSKALAVATATTSIVTGGVIATTGSSVSAAKSDCPDNSVCLWVKGDFTGTMYKVQLGTNGRVSDLPDYIEDEASSYFNNTKNKLVLYEDKRFEGYNLCSYPGTSSGNLSNFGIGLSFEDITSSIQAGSADSAFPGNGFCVYYDND